MAAFGVAATVVGAAVGLLRRIGRVPWGKCRRCAGDQAGAGVGVTPGRYLTGPQATVISPADPAAEGDPQ